MDEYTLFTIIIVSMSAAVAWGWWLGASVERDKWRRRAQISWELRRQHEDRVKL